MRKKCYVIFLNNQLDDSFWKWILTLDEKWAYLVNHNQSKHWIPKGQILGSILKQNQPEKKIMISIWWNFEGILHFELVPNGHTNTELCCKQFDRFYDVLVEKYPRLFRWKNALFQQDNTKPSTTRKTRNKMEELDIQLLVQTLLHMTTVSSNQCSTSWKVTNLSHLMKLKKPVRNFWFKVKGLHFGQIRRLPDHWQKVVETESLFWRMVLFLNKFLHGKKISIFT